MSKIENEIQATDRLIRVEKAIEILDIGESTFWEGVRNGRFPQPIKLSKRITRWRLSEIMAIIEGPA
jgi:prophage regulatory protein